MPGNLLKLSAAVLVTFVFVACRSTDKKDEATQVKNEASAESTGDAKKAAPAEKPKDCGQPPVSDCCSESTDDCRQCREAAITTLLEWKEHCASIEAYPCDKKPPQAECCTSSIPSCKACRDRNRRVQEDWGRRCK